MRNTDNPTMGTVATLMAKVLGTLFFAAQGMVHLGISIDMAIVPPIIIFFFPKLAMWIFEHFIKLLGVFLEHAIKILGNILTYVFKKGEQLLIYAWQFPAGKLAIVAGLSIAVYTVCSFLY